MSRFKNLFTKLNTQNRIAKIPFLMLGDPTIECSLKIIDSVIESKADALELGIPFSDPIADGPIIQQAANRARANGVTPSDCMLMIKQIRQKYPTLPIGLLVYANLAFHHGLDNFYQAAYNAGVDAVLIPDVPTREATPFCIKAKEYNIEPVLLATLACQDKDLEKVAQLSEGFVYVVTRTGVTGVHKHCEFEQAGSIVKKLKLLNAPPAVFGFGIQNANDIGLAYEHGASGAIIGSALIQALSQVSDHPFDHTVVKSISENLFGNNVNQLTT